VDAKTVTVSTIFRYNSRRIDRRVSTMPLISRAIFQLVHWAARKGLRDDRDDTVAATQTRCPPTGIRAKPTPTGISAAHGYVFVARQLHAARHKR